MRFSEDWLSDRYEHWPEWFAPLKDRPVKALEIGSFEGRSALWFLDNVLIHPDSTLVCVDPFVDWAANARGTFLENTMSVRASGKLVYHEEPSYEYLRRTDETFDLIYVDGSHKTGDVLTDAVLSWHRLKPDGLLLFDDYYLCRWEENKLPKVAIDSLLHCYEGQYELLHKGWQVLIRRRSC